MTYIGLAVVRVHTDQRNRARMISIGAVLASIIYNLLAGWFYRQPAILQTASEVAWLMLAALHGMPLAWVAFLVSDLLLHQDTTQDQVYHAQDDHCAPCEQVQPVITTNVINTILPAPDQTLAIESSTVIESEPIHDPYEYAMDLVLNGGKSIQESAKIASVPYSTLWRRLQRYNKE